MLAVTADATGVLLTVKLPTVVPAGRETVFGPVTAGLSLERLITTPPVGARPFRATVTLTGKPPIVVLTDGDERPPPQGIGCIDQTTDTTNRVDARLAKGIPLRTSEY